MVLVRFAIHISFTNLTIVQNQIDGLYRPKANIYTIKLRFDSLCILPITFNELTIIFILFLLLLLRFSRKVTATNKRKGEKKEKRRCRGQSRRVNYALRIGSVLFLAHFHSFYLSDIMILIVFLNEYSFVRGSFVCLFVG